MTLTRKGSHERGSYVQLPGKKERLEGRPKNRNGENRKKVKKKNEIQGGTIPKERGRLTLRLLSLSLCSGVVGDALVPTTHGGRRGDGLQLV